MKELILKAIFSIRAQINRSLIPPYPLSRKFGFDRGKPVDRFYIEKFMSENAELVHGRVLEITDNAYTVKYGENRVTQSDVLDIESKNKKANIISDIRDMKVIKDNTYDTVILTHVLGMIDDVHSAVKEIHRVLKQGGVVLVTLASFAPNLANNKAYWRITKEGASYLFSKYFGNKNIQVNAVGNYFSGQAFWMGMSLEDINIKLLEKNDADFPMITTVIAKKIE